MNDPTAELREKYQPKPLKVMEPDRQLTLARYSPGGAFLAAAAYDATIRRFRAEGDQITELPRLEGHHGWATALAFAPQTHRLLTADSWGQLRGWDIQPEPPAAAWTHPAAHDGWIRALAVSPDGAVVASAGRDGTIRLWNTADGAAQRELPAGGEIFALAFHPQQPALVSVNMRGVIQHWNLSDGQCSRQLEAGVFYLEHRLQEIAGARCLLFDPTGNMLLCAGARPTSGGNVQGVPTIVQFDWAAGQPVKTHELGKQGDGFVVDLHWHAEGFLMLVINGNPGQGKLQFRRLEDEAPLFEKPLPNPHSLAPAPDGSGFVVAATNTGSNGNGRQLNDKGEYPGNFSPLHFFQFVPKEEPAAAAS